ncbi:MAG TPA: von Willebrand factor type A domain-containing protein [Thermoanaerobaculia bacterium]|nr:von Willebrand factor type A domain-containing protein [Thermoanaerobaculia bacterium]
MSRLTEREVARRLAEPLDDTEPPEGLLEKIKAEIPPVVNVGTKAPGGKVVPFLAAAETPPAASRRHRWLIAASLAVMVIGGLFAWNFQKRMPLPELASEEAVSGEDLPRDSAMPPPPPPAAAPRPQASYDAPAGPPEADSETAAELKELGYLGGERRRQASPKISAPSDPVQPMEVESFKEELVITAESPLLDERRISAGAAVAEGVEGGVVGGVVGGSPGGVPGGAPMRYSAKQGTTGGNAEPNDEAYGDVFYRSAGTNPFVDTEEDARSTFGLDVDTASYTVTRRYLEDGNLPDPDSVRVEEFVNFFHYGDEPPARDDFAIRAEGAPTPFAPESHRLLRFNIRGREIRPEERKPAVLTFVIDISGSMQVENRLGLVKQSLEMLLNKLRPTDKVGVVVYGNEARVVLEPTHDLARAREAIRGLQTDGATNAEAGLLLGYDVANRYFRPEVNNRILLCSDGVANVGNTGPERILERIGKEARKGIELSTLGFGMGNYNDHLMEQLANKGDGRYAYLDTLDEARRVLVEELEGTLETIAKDAKVQVAFNPEVVERWRLLGYENRDIADDKFRDDTVDAGEIGAGHSVTALYEVKLKPGGIGGRGDKPVANLHLRWRSEKTGRVREEEKLLRLSQLALSWERATPSLRLASVVAEFAEILRGSYWARESSLDDLFRRTQRVSGELAGSRRAADVAELVSLIGKAARLKGQGGE